MNKEKLLIISASCFVVGIVLDILTTIKGLSVGLQEGNPLGWNLVLWLNILVLTLFYFNINKLWVYVNNENKGFKTLLYAFLIVGIYRTLIAMWNLHLIASVS